MTTGRARGIDRRKYRSIRWYGLGGQAVGLRLVIVDASPLSASLYTKGRRAAAGSMLKKHTQFEFSIRIGAQGNWRVYLSKRHRRIQEPSIILAQTDCTMNQTTLITHEVFYAKYYSARRGHDTPIGEGVTLRIHAGRRFTNRPERRDRLLFAVTNERR